MALWRLILSLRSVLEDGADFYLYMERYRLIHCFKSVLASDNDVLSSIYPPILITQHV